MGEDNRVPPLPRRVRGAAGVPGAAARVARPVLSESSLARIRAAFYGEPGQVAGQERSASSPPPAPLPRRVPGANRAAQAEAGHWRPATVPASAVPRVRRRTSGRKALASRGFRLAGAFASVILITAGSVAFALSRHTAAATARSGYGLAAEAAIRNLAAAWVADQVSRDAIVSCDPAMCQALEAHGIADGGLLELRPGTTDPLGSDVIVATAAVRSQFGGRLSSVYAPAIIASFGSGNLRITIRAIAPGGAAEYRSLLSADLLARKASGAQVLRNPRIVTSSMARKQLAAGRVDSRLLTTIAVMAALQRVDIVAFGDSAPGAGAGSPLRSADLAETGGARTGSAANMRSMLAFLRAQRTSYRAAHVEIVHAGGRTVLLVEFAAPSPLGLLSSPTP
jgi:hypothetical protein